MIEYRSMALRDIVRQETKEMFALLLSQSFGEVVLNRNGISRFLVLFLQKVLCLAREIILTSSN